MQIAPGSVDLFARFHLVVDDQAEPISQGEFDDAILDFVLSVVERRRSQRKTSTTVGTPAAAVDNTTGDSR